MRNKLLNRIAELAWRRPVLVILLALSLAAVGAVYASKALTLNANTDDLIASDRPFMIQYRQFLKEFGDLEYIYAVVQKKGGGKATPQNDDVIREAVDALTERLRRIPGLPGVYSSIHPSEQLRIATRAMPERELADLAKAAVAFPALLSGRTDRVINDAILLIKRLIGEGHKLSEQEQEKLGSAAIFLLKCIAASKPDSPSHNDMALLLGATQQREYFKSESGQLYFITIMPVKDYSTLSVIQEPLDKIRAAIDQVQGQYPEVEIGLTGKPVLQADEMATTNTDMTLASLLGVGLVSALFMISFGGIWRPLMAVIAFACGAAWTYGAATLLVGRLNLLSIVFMLVLVGVGLDYGIHVISRYRENRRRPMDVHESLVSAVRTAVRGNLTGALTSSAVFFTAWLTTFQGLRELGLIAGIGLLLCMFAMATVLPSLIALFDRRRFRTELEIPPGREFVPRSIEDRNWLVKRSTWVLGAAAIVTVSMIAVPGKLRFERNLLKLQASGLDSVKWEHRVIEDSASASWFGAAIAESQEPSATCAACSTSSSHRHSDGRNCGQGFSPAYLRKSR
jgi:predicted RND superfamily exporter protein